MFVLNNILFAVMILNSKKCYKKRNIKQEYNVVYIYLFTHVTQKIIPEFNTHFFQF